MCKASSLPEESPPPDQATRGAIDRGVALILVLFMVSLITVLVLRFVIHSREFLKEAEIFQNGTQAYFLARSAIEAGRVALVESSLLGVQSGQNYTSLNQPWATPLINYPVGHSGFLSGIIVDEASKLNLNLLAQSGGVPNIHVMVQFTRLFSLLGVNPGVLPSISQWVTPVPPGGSGGGPYASMIPSYRLRGGPMSVLSELHQIAGMDETVFRAIEPFVTVASNGQVNVNTASTTVLESLDPGITPELASRIVSGRPYSSLSTLSNILGPAIFSNIQGDLTTQSSIFSIQAVGTVGNTRQAVKAYLSVNGSQTQILAFRVGGNSLLGQIETLLKNAPAEGSTFSQPTMTGPS